MADEIPISSGSPAEIPLDNAPSNPGPSVTDRSPAVTDYEVPLKGAWKPIIEARQQDYQWPEIMGHIAGFQDRAAQYGYSQEQADNYLGYNTSALGSRLGGAIMNAVGQEGIHPIEAATDGWVKPTGNPDKPYNITDTPDTVRFDYAKALINGEAKGPQDFIDSYLNFAGNVTKTDLSPLKWGLTAQLPSPMQAVDYANGIAQQAGVYKSADIALTNLIDNWGTTGQPMAQTYQAAAKDPFLREALITPQQAASTKPQPSTFKLDPERQRLLDFLGYATPEFGMVKGFMDAMHGTTPPGEEKSDFNITPARIGEFLGKGLVASVKGIPTPEEAERIMAGNGTPDEQQRAFLYSTTLGGGGLFHGNVSPPVGVLEQALKDGKPGVLDEALDTFKQTLADSKGTLLDGVRAPRQNDFGEGAAKPSDMDMRLRRLTGSVNAGSLQIDNILRSVPDEWRAPAFQNALGDAIETRLYTPGTQMARSAESPLVSPEQQAYLDGPIKQLTDMERELGERVASKTDIPTEKFIGVDDGYMHRIWDQKQLASLDPNVAMELTSGTIPPNKLSRYAASMQGRSDSMYVFDHGDGTRVWGKDPLENLGDNPATGKPYQIGDTVEAPTGQNIYIGRPTMKEIEANTPNFTGSHNHLINTLTNVDRLQKVDKTLDFINDTAKDLSDRGQFIPNSEAGLPRGVVPQGYVETKIPGLKGYMDPRIANAINDFWQTPGPVMEKLNRVAQWLINPMFLDPVPHMWNMGNGYLMNRAADWIDPVAYPGMIRSINTAAREIATRGPIYQEHVAAGSGLPSSSQAAMNFRNFLSQKTLADIKADPGTWGPVANGLGVKLADMYNGMQNSIHSAMWFTGDVMKLARELEWKAKGYSLDDAINLTQKDMVPYQLPTELLGSHTLSQAMKQPVISPFFRYHYGLANSVANFAKDITGPLRGNFTLEGAEAYNNAVAKAVLAGAIAYYQIPFLYNHGVSKWVDNAEQGKWRSLINGIASTSPVVKVFEMITQNKDFFGNDIVKDKAGWSQKVVEGAKAASDLYWPAQVAVKGYDKGWGPAFDDVLGSTFSKENKPPSAYQDREDQYKVYQEYNRPGFIHDMTNLLGGSSPATPAPMFTHKPSTGGHLPSGYKGR